MYQLLLTRVYGLIFVTRWILYWRQSSNTSNFRLLAQNILPYLIGNDHEVGESIDGFPVGWFRAHGCVHNVFLRSQGPTIVGPRGGAVFGVSFLGEPPSGTSIHRRIRRDTVVVVVAVGERNGGGGKQ